MPVELLQVEPTSRCNFTCGFCVGRHFDQSDLDPGSLDRILDTFPEVRHLELQGEGEPLLHPAFFEMAARARERGIEVSTITNGSCFTPRNIERLFAVDLRSLLVSIESPDPEEFRAIRGGRLDKVVAGIRALVAARGARGRSRPTIGFAVTVLRRTRDRLPELFDLYEELGLDGGILVHMLSPMEAYADRYAPETSREVLSPMEQALVWSRFAKLRARRGLHESGDRHFWSEMFAAARGSSSAGRPAPLESCPWLDRGLFVDRHGNFTACPNVKDGRRFSLGRVGDAPGDVTARRGELAARLAVGDVPEPCRRCFIAESIAGRTGRSRSENRAEEAGDG